MKLVKFYLAGSILIGILQIIDGASLSFEGLGDYNTSFSLLEILWVPISLAAVMVFSIFQLPELLPVSYIIYNVWGWGYGLYLASKIEGPEDLSIPLWFAVFGACFGVYFAVFSFGLYRKYFIYKT